MSNDSMIEILPSGSVMYSGIKAVDLFRAISIKAALYAYGKHRIKMNRNLTPTTMLKIAQEYTHKAYKRGQYLEAAEDLQARIEIMRHAIPVVDRESTAETITRVSN